MFGLKKIRSRLDELEKQRVAGHLMDIVTKLANLLGYHAYYTLGKIEVVEPKGSLPQRVESLEEQMKRLDVFKAETLISGVPKKKY